MIIQTLLALLKPRKCDFVEHVFGFQDLGLELVDCHGNGVGRATSHPKHDKIELFNLRGNALAPGNHMNNEQMYIKQRDRLEEIRGDKERCERLELPGDDVTV